MVEGSDLLLQLACVHADSHTTLHSSQFKIERLLVGSCGGRNIAAFCVDLDLDSSVLDKDAEELRSNSMEVILQVVSCLG